jgi:uncharacterized protein (DUF736 family)
MSEKKQSVGGAWKKSTAKGEVISLEIGGKRYSMWPNKYKEKPNQPDYRIFEDDYVKPQGVQNNVQNHVQSNSQAQDDLPF